MKALIRNDGETVTEKDNIAGIDWTTGAPLTNPAWAGGPYKMVEIYIPQMTEKDTVQPKQAEVDEKIVENDDYVVIDGKKYNKEELRSLLE